MRLGDRAIPARVGKVQSGHGEVVPIWGEDIKALFSCDGTVPLSHTNDRFKTERKSFSQQKRSPNGTVPSQPNRA